MSREVDAVRRLQQEQGPNLAFVVNHSVGKDSTRMLGFVRRRFPDAPIYVVMADTGFEHQKPISAADFARQRCAEFGLELTVVRNPKRTYLEMVEQRGMFPSAQYRQCTSDLKRGPVEKYIRSLPHRVIVNCIGIRAEESNSRSKLSPLQLNRNLTTHTRTVYNWFSDLRSDPRPRPGMALGERSPAASGVRARVPQGWDNRRIPAPILLPGLHLLDRRRPVRDSRARP